MKNINLNSTSNNTKSVNKIKINFFQGQLTNNIFPVEQEVEINLLDCKPNSLDFTCKENSGYIVVV